MKVSTNTYINIKKIKLNGISNLNIKMYNEK